MNDRFSSWLRWFFHKAPITCKNDTWRIDAVGFTSSPANVVFARYRMSFPMCLYIEAWVICSSLFVFLLSFSRTVMNQLFFVTWREFLLRKLYFFLTSQLYSRVAYLTRKNCFIRFKSIGLLTNLVGVNATRHEIVHWSHLTLAR